MHNAVLVRVGSDGFDGDWLDLLVAAVSSSIIIAEIAPRGDSPDACRASEYSLNLYGCQPTLGASVDLYCTEPCGFRRKKVRVLVYIRATWSHAKVEA